MNRRIHVKLNKTDNALNVIDFRKLNIEQQKTSPMDITPHTNSPLSTHPDPLLSDVSVSDSDSPNESTLETNAETNAESAPEVH